MKQVLYTPESQQSAEIAMGTARLLLCFGVICLFFVAATSM